MVEQLTIKEYKEQHPEPLRHVSLCFLVNGSKILLAMKKRGFGKDRWNGYGGKPEPEETIEDTAIRETREEIGIVASAMSRVATLNFFFPSDPTDRNNNQKVSVFLINQWEGDPLETEEMKPQWFDLEQVPYDQMWPDDRYWLPQVLEGKNIEGEFMFDQDNNIIDSSVNVVTD